MSTSPNQSKPSYDVIVIGGGVVGLAVARAASVGGYKCAVLEREAHLLQWASGSNSGIACTGVDATPGTLERALIRDAIAQLPTFLQQMNIPHDACGSLVCQWPWDDVDTGEQVDYGRKEDRLGHVLAESHMAGDMQARYLSSDMVLDWEPHLNENVQGAVHIPGEIVLDPWLYSIALAVHARALGCTICTDTTVMDPASMQWDGTQWTILTRTTSDPTAEGITYRAKTIVCATGAWAADWDQAIVAGTSVATTSMKSEKDLRAAPRRGQYRIFQANDKTSLRHPIQPIPTQRTKGIFVFATLYSHIVVGPTALDQESKTDCTIDPRVAQDLTRHVQRILPGLQPEMQYVGEYVGIRPGTNQRDYQIRVHACKHWITVAGIRSTGLTASLGIGRHVTYLLEQLLRDMGVSPGPCIDHIPITPLPPLTDLIKDFQSRQDYCVSIHGHDYKVTHPLTRLGWKHFSHEKQN